MGASTSNRLFAVHIRTAHEQIYFTHSACYDNTVQLRWNSVNRFHPVQGAAGEYRHGEWPQPVIICRRQRALCTVFTTRSQRRLCCIAYAAGTMCLRLVTKVESKKNGAFVVFDAAKLQKSAACRSHSLSAQ